MTTDMTTDQTIAAITDDSQLSMEERVKVPGLAVHMIEQMTDIAKVKRLAQTLRDALSANLNLQNHHLALVGGWESCGPCEKAAAECDQSAICEQAKRWQAEVDAAWKVS
ncbi:hypothetical protein [Streptomyces lonarensis]|uniref:Uncharacterized protein n=1 Tax=Streptomyces lonarensis TaxID=700599 RepID=A0A7X6CX97_9ACTN|nr:hypothetical protein [Streptomyces lonarensis]NJQ04242.1 hypothetical protein [Streptomyces lonarensis]